MLVKIAYRMMGLAEKLERLGILIDNFLQLELSNLSISFVNLSLILDFTKKLFEASLK